MYAQSCRNATEVPPSLTTGVSDESSATTTAAMPACDTANAVPVGAGTTVAIAPTAVLVSSTSAGVEDMQIYNWFSAVEDSTKAKLGDATNYQMAYFAYNSTNICKAGMSGIQVSIVVSSIMCMIIEVLLLHAPPLFYVEHSAQRDFQSEQHILWKRGSAYPICLQS